MSCLSNDGQQTLDHLPIDGQVWRVHFDRLGVLLATSAVDGDESIVYLWELNPQGQWYPSSRIAGECQQSDDSDGAMLD